MEAFDTSKFLDGLDITEEEKEKLLDNKGVTKDTLLVPSVYAPIFDESENAPSYYLLASGRLSGKTSILVALWWIYFNKYPDKDIVILQSTSVEIKDSIIVEIEKFLRRSGYDVGDSPTNEFYIPRRHDSVTRLGWQNSTKIFPITDSRGGQRSRGVSTENRISLVLYEEVQKNIDRNVVDQSLFTFVRQVEDGAKIVVVGNNETAGHWFVDFTEEKKNDPTWKYIYASCYDIWSLLSNKAKEQVENFKKNNPIEFDRIFMGNIFASTSDVVFPQFDRKKHYRKKEELQNIGIDKLIVGIDHATANDTFAIVPVAILCDGTAQTLEVCYDDPKESQRSISPSEQCDLLEKFMDFIDDTYGLGYYNIETVLSVDGAASPFIAQLRHLKRTARNKRLWATIGIKAFTLKKKDVNLGIIKNAFAYDVLKILNEGFYTWNNRENKHRLCKEIESQRYKNGRLDPKIPNDLCDALEYGLVPYYSNCYNLSFPLRKARADAHYDEIRKLANMR